MSRFVDDEQAEIQVGSGLSGVEESVKKGATENESVPAAVGAAAGAPEEGYEDAKKDAGAHHYRKRKSLQEQLLNNRMYKYRERRKKLEKQNSSFKMRKDTREFYGKLSTEKQAKKQAEREAYERELALFRRLKEKQKVKGGDEGEDHEDQARDAEPAAEPSAEPEAPSAGLVAYSDSDSE
ncbi:hypothetical protein PMKS-001308 [Pichia membranifaciens]|uniref:FAM192A/Fyv6 N-terminal domain-containing protein n=1 Tax=Pichia membranifaciens TaxID=4926 RepID=A0A1Q2YE70_9ASCO|nr:hypothetical protein PMKS-001308 [Pichia membranifaciens]